MKPWFAKEADIIKFPEPVKNVVELPNVQSYPDFLTGVKDLHNRKEKGEISQASHDKLYQDLIHRFMRKEDYSKPWFEKELEEDAMTARDYAPLINTLSSQGLNVNPRPKPSRLRKIVHARITNPVEKITDVLTQLGAKFKVIPGPNELSGKFSQIVAQFPKQLEKQYPELAGKTFNIASAVKKGSSVGIKVFTPTNLGLANKIMSRTELYNTLKSTIPGKVNDEITEELLLQLVDVAVKKRKAVDPDIIEQFNADDLRQLGVDFGEILGPLMSGEDAIKFPAGNSMLADVEINGKPISVKSASGSGTSFKAILPYLDKLKNNKAVKLNKEEKKVNNFFRAFVDTKGNNMDKIVAGSTVANTPEHQAMATLVGNKNFTVADLENYASKFGKREYGKFLNAIYPVAIAGGYKIADKDRPNGLPQDAAYYMHKSDKKPKAKQAGKPSWDAQGSAVAGRNIMVYILGASFLKDAKRIEKKEKFSNFLSKVMQGANAEIMWVNINPNGTLSLQRKPIKDVQADFQYHAPSHIPGNNLPGFSLKL
tara:strand:+ start:1079 stop:2698 length:1620 start_codon:yes stop_codon:yes gene_type:complete